MTYPCMQKWPTPDTGLDGISVDLADWTLTSLAGTGSTQLLDEHHLLQLGPILLSHGVF